MEQKKSKTIVQIVGHYYAESLSFPAYIANHTIQIQNKCIGISPITLCGDSDEKLESEWENKIKDLQQWKEKPSDALFIRQSQELFDIKKNFPKFLSRERDYCDNTVFSGIGKEVVYSNDADYIIVDHSGTARGIIKYNNRLYTHIWPDTPFTEFLISAKDKESINPRYITPEFNWKYYFDKYIDAILDEYDSSHIILIKTPYSKFYYENNKLKHFPTLQPKLHNLLSEMDDYFAERTGCHVIDDLYSRIPVKYLNPHGYPYGNALGNWQKSVIKQLTQIISSKAYQSLSLPKYDTPIAKLLCKKLRKDKLNKFTEMLNTIEQLKIHTAKKLFKAGIINDELNEISVLEPFINDCCLTLSDYIDKCTVQEKLPDIALVEAYTELFKCDLNDILSIYELYTSNKYPDKKIFGKIIANLCSSDDSTPIKNSNALFENNLERLKIYSYLDKKHLNITIDPPKYIQICDSVWLIIDKNAEEQIKICANLMNNKFDFHAVIKNGYVCKIEDADALTFSYQYYIEKARRGDGASPTFLKFDSTADFHKSMCYIDYFELLENEKFVFLIGDEQNEIHDDYVPVVDFTELMDPELVTVRVDAGLGDQICHYVLGQMIKKYGGGKVIYDDTNKMGFNEFEVFKYAKEPMNLLSSKLSKRLTPPLTFNNGLFKKIYANISDDYIYICKKYDVQYKPNAQDSPVILISKCKNLINNVLNKKIHRSYYQILIRLEDWKKNYDFELSDYIQFPPFTEKKHIELVSKINSSDSIIVHIRRGDYVSLGWDTDAEFYAEAVEKILKIEQYKNKKFFVFSDDIYWCKSNKKKLGLCDVGDAEVVFVEENKGDECFRDIQLMALGKVIIAGSSYFPRISMLYGTNWEIFTSPFGKSMDIIPNKYDIGPYKKDYNTNYNNREPKK